MNLRTQRARSEAATGTRSPIPNAAGRTTSTVTVAPLRNPDWKSRCIRNCQTIEAEKRIAYDWLEREHGEADRSVRE
jgi:hypothetical protein